MVFVYHMSSYSFNYQTGTWQTTELPMAVHEMGQFQKML